MVNKLLFQLLSFQNLLCLDFIRSEQDFGENAFTQLIVPSASSHHIGGRIPHHAPGSSGCRKASHQDHLFLRGATGPRCWRGNYPVLPSHNNGITDITKIVPKYSAILPAYNSMGIHANHMDMTKFDHAQNAGYKAGSNELWGWAKAIRS